LDILQAATLKTALAVIAVATATKTLCQSITIMVLAIIVG